MIFHKKQLIIKPSMGLGDAVYCYPVVEYYRNNNPNKNIKVLTKYKEVFENLKNITFSTERSKFDIDCTYLNRKKIKETNQFEDILINSNCPKNLNFDINIKIKKIKIETSKKILLVRNPYLGMELRKDILLTPDLSQIINFLNKLKKKYYIILLRHKEDGTNIFYKNFDHILDETSINQLMNLVFQSDLIISQNGHILALAEGLNKNIICFFSSKLKKTNNIFFNSITPKKVITKKTSNYVYDDDLEKINFLFKKLI